MRCSTVGHDFFNIWVANQGVFRVVWAKRSLIFIES